MRATTMRSIAALAILLGSLVAPRPAAANEAQLLECQNMLREAAGRYGDDLRRRLGACVTRGIECLLADGESRCVDRAKQRCAMDLSRVERGRARFHQRVTGRRCTALSPTDLLAGSGLGYGEALAECTAGVPTDLASLVACLDELMTRDLARQVVEIEQPRGCESLALVMQTAAFPGVCAPLPTPTPVLTPTPTLTETLSATPSGTPTLTPTSTTTVTPTASPTATPTASPTETATATVTPSANPTVTATATATATPTTTPTLTPTLAATQTVTPTATATPTATPTVTATVTATVTPTATATATPIVTSTIGATPTVTPTVTATPTRTATVTPTATATLTPVATPTATATQTPVPSPTATTAGPVCGNSIVEAGEDCDDGNTLGCDACAVDCRNPQVCDAGVETVTIAVDYDALAVSVASGIDGCVLYDSGKVALPVVVGQIVSPARSTIEPSSSTILVLDFERSATQRIQNPPNPQPDYQTTLQFDVCSGQTPTADDFDCQILLVADGQGNELPLDQATLVTCTLGILP